MSFVIMRKTERVIKYESDEQIKMVNFSIAALDTRFPFLSIINDSVWFKSQFPTIVTCDIATCSMIRWISRDLNSQLNPDLVCKRRPICNDFSIFPSEDCVSRPNFHILLLWLNLQITKNRCMSHLLHSLNTYNICSMLVWAGRRYLVQTRKCTCFCTFCNIMRIIWRLWNGIDFAPHSIIGFLDVHISSSMTVESVIKSTQSSNKNINFFSLRQL